MNQALIAHLRDLCADFGELSARPMFGGYGLYFNGLITAIVIEDGLYLKVDAETAPEFIAAGCAPYIYRGQRKPIELSYWSVPEQAMDSPEDMRPWLELAYDAALRKAQAPKKRSPRPRKR